MVFRSEVAALLAPGEFVEISVPCDASQVLRVPLSFSRADAAAGTVRIEYAVVGDGTHRLSLMRPGDASTLVGPCGHGWRLPGGEGRSLLVAGGIGLPPVLAAAEMLAAQKGLGYMIQTNRMLANADNILVGMLLIGVIGAIFSLILGLLEKQLAKGR